MLQSKLNKISLWSEHDQKLAEQVHPFDWINPDPAARYNLVVIGAGTAGLVSAAGAAGLGAKVALIERDMMGGDCLNVGCVPSKAVISAARASAAVRDSATYGVNVPNGVTFGNGVRSSFDLYHFDWYAETMSRPLRIDYPWGAPFRQYSRQGC